MMLQFVYPLTLCLLVHHVRTSSSAPWALNESRAVPLQAASVVRARVAKATHVSVLWLICHQNLASVFDASGATSTGRT